LIKIKPEFEKPEPLRAAAPGDKVAVQNYLGNISFQCYVHAPKSLLEIVDLFVQARAREAQDQGCRRLSLLVVSRFRTSLKTRKSYSASQSNLRHRWILDPNYQPYWNQTDRPDHPEGSRDGIKVIMMFSVEPL
jgi:hypothetical protein